MGIALLLIPLIPGLIDAAMKLVSAAKSDPSNTPETRAKLDALSARLDATNQAVQDLPVRDV